MRNSRAQGSGRRCWLTAGVALLALSCSGRDILLSTGTTETDGSGKDLSGGGFVASSAGRGGDGTGGSFFGGSGDQTTSGEAGRSGWVAYDADLSQSGGVPGRHIYVATTDGACQRPLTSGPAQEKQPAFSADGSSSRLPPTPLARSKSTSWICRAA